MIAREGGEQRGRRSGDGAIFGSDEGRGLVFEDGGGVVEGDVGEGGCGGDGTCGDVISGGTLIGSDEEVVGLAVHPTFSGY
ncbi:hypothetical protein Scep_028068 [Stephania cephalantha]|uniref:Uncharacterized protein n=1 Tax=Stephania cephalantha TaxID=152367 RepID=A0AAP0E979_9MAGN